MQNRMHILWKKKLSKQWNSIRYFGNSTPCSVGGANISNTCNSIRLPKSPFAIQDTAIKIFQYLDSYSLWCCKMVNKQWFSDATSLAATMYAMITAQVIKEAILKKCDYMIPIPCDSNDCRVKLLKSSEKDKYPHMDCIHSLGLYNCGSIEIDNHLLSESLLIPLLCCNYSTGLPARMFHNARINFGNTTAIGLRYKSRVKKLRIVAGLSPAVRNDAMSKWIEILSLIKFEHLQSLEICLSL